jgi:hypothetical protein
LAQEPDGGEGRRLAPTRRQERRRGHGRQLCDDPARSKDSWPPVPHATSRAATGWRLGDVSLAGRGAGAALPSGLCVAPCVPPAGPRYRRR